MRLNKETLKRIRDFILCCRKTTDHLDVVVEYIESKSTSNIYMEEKITTVKIEKHPRRVEAGKRLAKISKESKERKMCERIKKEESYTLYKNYKFIFGAVGVVGTLAAIYYARNSNKKEIKELKAIREELQD